MNTIFVLVNRNRKLFFRDKGMLISALITPLILIVLYGTFLARVYKDSFRSSLPAAFAVVGYAHQRSGGSPAGSRSSGGQLRDCDLLRESDHDSGPGQRHPEGFQRITGETAGALPGLFLCYSVKFPDGKRPGPDLLLYLYGRNGLLFKRNGRPLAACRYRDSCPFRKQPLWHHLLSLEDPGPDVSRGKLNCQRRLRLSLRRLYADCQFRLRPSERRFLLFPAPTEPPF